MLGVKKWQVDQWTNCTEVLSYFVTYWNTTRPVWLEKSPPLYANMPFIHTCMLNASLPHGRVKQTRNYRVSFEQASNGPGFKLEKTLDKRLRVKKVFKGSQADLSGVPFGSRLVRVQVGRWSNKTIYFPHASDKGTISAIWRKGDQSYSIDFALDSSVDFRVQRLLPRYVIMWRPWCLHVLSSHKWTEETRAIIKLAHAHRQLRAAGADILVINYGDFLWRQHKTKRRLEKFVPCLGALDYDFVPKQGVHVFEGNMWKATASVKTFAALKKPFDCCKYDVARAMCLEGQEGYKDDNVSLRSEAVSSTEYLRKFSRD